MLTWNSNLNQRLNIHYLRNSKEGNNMNLFRQNYCDKTQNILIMDIKVLLLIICEIKIT